MREAVESHGRIPLDEDVWDGFARRLSYVSVPFDKEDGYARLRSHLEDLDAELGTRGNRLFYLATAPEFFPVIAEQPRRRGARRGARRRRALRPPRDREALRQRPRLGARAERPPERGLPRAAGLPHRPLPREGDGPEHAGAAVRQRDLRAGLEPPLRRPRPDHRGRGPGRGDARRLLRPSRRRAARHRAEPHAPGALDRGHGAAGALREPRGARREGQGAARGAALRRRHGPARRGARPVRRRAGSRASRFRATARRRASTRARNTETFVALRMRRSTTGAGPGRPSTCAPASAFRGARPRSRSSSSRRRTCPSPRPRWRPSQPNLLVLRIQPDEGASLRFLAKVPGPQIDLREVSMDFAYGSVVPAQASPEAYERLLLDALLGRLDAVHALGRGGAGVGDPRPADPRWETRLPRRLRTTTTPGPGARRRPTI